MLFRRRTVVSAGFSWTLWYDSIEKEPTTPENKVAWKWWVISVEVQSRVARTYKD
jgi:hypothetical protein